jgi:predicted dehydrogenase
MSSVPTSSPAPLRFAIIGLGGYAGAHHEALLRLEAEGEVRLVATCDPQAALYEARAGRWRLRERGVEWYPDHAALLAATEGRLDCVIVPTPIALHAAMHRAAVERGVAVYLEKPPTLDPEELSEMERVEAGAKFATQVGFNFIVEARRRALKARLVAGEFGRVRELRFLGLWPRAESYFGRNDWSGRLLRADGGPLLDSCFGNAMAHFVHNLLFWGGASGLDAWARPGRCRAVLARAHDIEGPDTVLVEAGTDDGVSLRLALSHACSGAPVNREEIVCEGARIRYEVERDGEIIHADGRRESWAAAPFDAVTENLRAYARYLRGQSVRPGTRLAESRPFVTLNALAYVSAPRIHDFRRAGPAPGRLRVAEGDWQRPVPGLAEAAEAFVQRGVWPETWGVPGAWVEPGQLGLLGDRLRAFRAEAAGGSPPGQDCR